MVVSNILKSARVTRLGNVRLLGNCFFWPVFFKYGSSPNFGFFTFYTEKVICTILQKLDWAAIWVFFTKSSGHPDEYPNNDETFPQTPARTRRKHFRVAKQRLF
jgi:hypothetical protein